MKYLLLFALLAGCVDKPEPTPVETEQDPPAFDMIVKIRNCEYIRAKAYSSNADYYIHCGDCTNPIHQTQK